MECQRLSQTPESGEAARCSPESNIMGRTMKPVHSTTLTTPLFPTEMGTHHESVGNNVGKDFHPYK